jgi:hypothetical protein
VLHSIREIRTERQPRNPNVYVSSPQYLSTRQDDPVLIGPAVSFSWGGRNEQSQTRVDMIGSPQMQQRFVDISYECMVKFDDGRYAGGQTGRCRQPAHRRSVQVVDKRVVRVSRASPHP